MLGRALAGPGSSNLNSLKQRNSQTPTGPHFPAFRGPLCPASRPPLEEA